MESQFKKRVTVCSIMQHNEGISLTVVIFYLLRVLYEISLLIPANQTMPNFPRNSLEAYLTIRGQEYIAALRREPGVIDRAEAIEHGISPEELRDLFGPGAGMDHPVEDDRSNRGFFGGRKSKKDVVKK